MSTPRPALAELRQLLWLAAPIFISQFSQAAYGFIDTVMSGQVSALDLAAVAVGSSIWLPLFLLTTGTLLATTPLVAEAHGAEQPERIQQITHQALWLALLVGITGLLLIRHAWPLFDWLGVEPALRDLTRAYLEGVSWGMPAVGLFFVLRCYCEAQGRPVPVMLISLLGLGLNVAANALFIEGSAAWGLDWGIPAMGGPGCGWGTAVVMWGMSLVLLAYVLLAPVFAPVRLLRRHLRPHWPEIRHIAALGLPIGLAIFFEVSSFSLVAVLISPSGAIVVAGHQVALSVTSIIFMVPLSLAIALTIRTGQQLGARDLAGIFLTRRVGLTTTTLIACTSALLLYTSRDSIASWFSEDLAVRALAAHLLLFAVAYQIFDALQVGAAGCLRGLQDTRSPMLLTLVAYWGVAIPFGIVAGSTDWLGQVWGASGYWTGLVLGLGVACVLLNWQLHRRLRRMTDEWTEALGNGADGELGS